MNNNKKLELYVASRNLVILFIIFLILGTILYNIIIEFESPREVADNIKELGPLGPIAIIILTTLEIVIAPVPGFIITLASGFAFGGFFGAIYSYIGTIFGTAIAFSLSKHFGRPFVETLISKKKIIKYDSFFKKQGKKFLWIVFLFPVFPIDVVSFIAGLSKLKLKEFMFIISIAYIPYIVLVSYFGASLYKFGLGTAAYTFGFGILFLFLIGIALYFYIDSNGKNNKSNSKIL